MDYQQFLQKTINPTKNYHIFYDRSGRPSLILDNNLGFLTEEEIVDYASVMPLVYDHVAGLEYEQLIDANLTVGGIIRNLFGLFSHCNPYTEHTDDSTDTNSPENVSYRVLKKLWYNSHRI